MYDEKKVYKPYVAALMTLSGTPQTVTQNLHCCILLSYNTCYDSCQRQHFVRDKSHRCNTM